MCTTHKQQQNETYPIEYITGKWHAIDNYYSTNAQLNLFADNTFIYTKGKYGFVGHSRGYYEVVFDTIILNSITPDTCVNFQIFGNDFHDFIYLDDYQTDSVTIEWCIPKNKRMVFVKFDDVKLFLIGDKLTFRTTDSLNVFHKVGNAQDYVK